MRGDVAQLGERYVRIVQAVGSNPIISTIVSSPGCDARPNARRKIPLVVHVISKDGNPGGKPFDAHHPQGGEGSSRRLSGPIRKGAPAGLLEDTP